MRKILIALFALLPLTGCGDESQTGVSYTVVTTATHDCAKGANISIDASDGTFKLTGTCERMLISGGNNRVTIEATKRIDINGANNVVEVDAVDVIRVNSSGNTINYKKGLAEKRRMSSQSATTTASSSRTDPSARMAGNQNGNTISSTPAGASACFGA